MAASVFLIPTVLEDESLHVLPPYVLDTIRSCQVIFAENERTTRRLLKKMDRQIVIDDFTWFGIHKAEEAVLQQFKQECALGKRIAIISEAGCPGIADPGQLLIAEAQRLNVPVHPLVGPSSLLLALMASGMNGQQFSFHGYLPIDTAERQKSIQEIERLSARNQSAHLFIETPYRNQQLLEQLLKVCKPSTKICIASNLTAPNEWIITQTVANWKQDIPILGKLPCIFIIQVAGG